VTESEVEGEVQEILVKKQGEQDLILIRLRQRCWSEEEGELSVIPKSDDDRDEFFEEHVPL
jgi:hypothetical protein